MNKMARCAVIGLALTGLLATAAVAADDAVIPVFKLKGPMSEQPDQSGMAALLGGQAPTDMFGLLKTLKQARTDDKVKAVIFHIDNAQLGFGQIAELRTQIEKLRAADKDVWVLSEGLGNGTLLLGSAASHLIMVPSGEVLFNGLYADSAYFKGLLDNIHVKADILHCGDFKSAGEPFYRTGPSPEAEAQTNRLLDSIFDLMIEGIADSRSISKDDVRKLIDVGIFSAAEALDAKLIDGLMYREDFVRKIKKQYGDEVEVVSDYGGKDGPEVDFGNPFAIFKIFGEMMKPKKDSDGAAIAVVYVEGAITSGPTEQGLFGGTSNAGSDTVRKAIAEAAACENVKALVLRVDSPGGSALASDVICEAAKRFKDSGRPFIVSMGNVAASGGYYVSALADTIYAEPGTITGSIGVVGGKLVTSGFWEWIGISSHEYKRGARSDVMNTNRVFNEEERELIQGYMNRVYGEFKDRVTTGRGDKLTGPIDSLAGGRVYTGAEALDIGLVDKLGGFRDAIRFAAREAEVSDYELRVYPRPKTLMDILAEAFGGKESDDSFVSLGITGRGAVGSKFASHPTIAAAMEAAKTLDPAKAKLLQNFLIQLELLSTERVLLVGPSLTTLPR